MSTILRNDKVVLVKEYGELKLVGDTFEVANVTETAVVLRDPLTKVAVGAIDIDDFDNYFQKKLNGWCNWEILRAANDDMIGAYRTNGKKVQVRVEGFRGEATCNKIDNFNLNTGIEIAFYRSRLKYLNDTYKQLTNDVADTMKQLANDIAATDKEIQSIKKKIKNIVKCVEPKKNTEGK